jgi:hypothetical protein
MRKLLLVLSVLFSSILSAQSKELVETVNSLELGDVYIQYFDTLEEEDGLALISGVSLPDILKEDRPYKRERDRVARYYYYNYRGYVVCYTRFKGGDTALGVCKK